MFYVACKIEECDRFFCVGEWIVHSCPGGVNMSVLFEWRSFAWPWNVFGEKIIQLTFFFCGTGLYRTVICTLPCCWWANGNTTCIWSKRSDGNSSGCIRWAEMRSSDQSGVQWKAQVGLGCIVTGKSTAHWSRLHRLKLKRREGDCLPPVLSPHLVPPSCHSSAGICTFTSVRFCFCSDFPA